MKRYIILISAILLLFSGCSHVSVNTNPTDNNGHLEISKQDQYSEVIDLKMNRKLDDITLLKNHSIGERNVLAETTGYVPVVGDWLCLKDVDGKAFLQTEILAFTNIVGNQYNFTIDMPLDFGFSVDDGCSINSVNLAVDGSVTPITFKISPGGLANNVSWDIVRMMFGFAGDGVGSSNEAPDDTGFGTETALTNGIVLRTVDGITKNIFNAKTNGDLRQRSGNDLLYVDSNRLGLYAVHARRTFNGDDKNGVTIRLNGATNDTLELIVQDDLTDMEEFQVVVQGHVVE